MRAGLDEPIRAALGDGPGEISPIPGVAVADSTIKMLVRDGRGVSAAVVICSPPVNPDLVERDVQRAAAAKDRLGARLGSVILSPLATGRFQGLSYVILPWRKPVAGRWQIWRLRHRVLDWLQEATAATVAPVAGSQVESDFLVPLRHLAGLPGLSERLRQSAQRSAQSLESGQWKARCVLAHNDLWTGNLLLDRNDFGFVVIDWGGSNLTGHAIFDLVRLATSVDLSSRGLASQLANHARILECSPDDARGHLLASLGRLAMNLDRFPMERFVAMAESCYTTLAESQAAG